MSVKAPTFAGKFIIPLKNQQKQPGSFNPGALNIDRFLEEAEATFSKDFGIGRFGPEPPKGQPDPRPYAGFVDDWSLDSRRQQIFDFLMDPARRANFRYIQTGTSGYSISYVVEPENGGSNDRVRRGSKNLPSIRAALDLTA
ncbi:MAG: hypothetical protein K2X01_09070 [Cyanobacteria bacterium]|nr:hypothetical protein [Cyanobacteriota bacterium]